MSVYIILFMQIILIISKEGLPTSQFILTPSRLCTLSFNEKEITKIIRNLNVHKAPDVVFIRMVKIWDKSILKPLILLFKNSTTSSYYPDIQGRSNIIPVHKTMINDLYITTDHSLYQNLVNANQSTFRLSDTCVNQLLPIAH